LRAEGGQLTAKKGLTTANGEMLRKNADKVPVEGLQKGIGTEGGGTRKKA